MDTFIKTLFPSFYTETEKKAHKFTAEVILFVCFIVDVILLWLLYFFMPIDTFLHSVVTNNYIVVMIIKNVSFIGILYALYRTNNLCIIKHFIRNNYIP